MVLPATTAALQDRLLTDLRDFIAELPLKATSGATTDIQNVVVQILPERLDPGALPFVILTCLGESEDEPSDCETFETVGVVYPVGVLIVDAVRMQYQLARKDYLSWRGTIKQAARNRSVFFPQPNVLPNCPELADMRIRNKPVWVPKLAEDQLLVSAFTILCDTSEARDATD